MGKKGEWRGNFHIELFFLSEEKTFKSPLISLGLFKISNREHKILFGVKSKNNIFYSSKDL